MKRVYQVIVISSLLTLLVGCGSSEPKTLQNGILSRVESDTEVDESYEVAEQEEEFDYHSVRMSEVTSTVIAEEGYDRDNRVLLIRFRSDGSLYAYYDVSENVFDELVNAESQGSYFSNSIRDIYRYERLESGEDYEVEPLYDETTYDKATFVLNTGTGKFHNKDCRYADAENIAYVSNSKSELEDLGYHACKVCKPE